MKRIVTLFTVQCFAIIYLTACTSVDEYAFTQSVAPIITNGTWKVNSFVKSNANQTTDFTGYEFVFNGDGTLTVTRNGITENGFWSEDNVSKKVHITITTHNTVLHQLDDVWNVSGVSTTELRFDNADDTQAEHLGITNL